MPFIPGERGKGRPQPKSHRQRHRDGCCSAQHRAMSAGPRFPWPPYHSAIDRRRKRRGPIVSYVCRVCATRRSKRDELLALPRTSPTFTSLWQAAGSNENRNGMIHGTAFQQPPSSPRHGARGPETSRRHPTVPMCLDTAHLVEVHRRIKLNLKSGQGCCTYK